MSSYTATPLAHMAATVLALGAFLLLWYGCYALGAEAALRRLAGAPNSDSFWPFFVELIGCGVLAVVVRQVLANLFGADNPVGSPDEYVTANAPDRGPAMPYKLAVLLKDNRFQHARELLFASAGTAQGAQRAVEYLLSVGVSMEQAAEGVNAILDWEKAQLRHAVRHVANFVGDADGLRETMTNVRDSDPSRDPLAELQSAKPTPRRRAK